MKTEPLNYLRHAIPYVESYVIPVLKQKGFHKAGELANMLLKACKESPKFVLPYGGRIIENSEFKGITGDLHLPYESIVIEYEPVRDNPGLAGEVFGDDSVISRKRIVYAEEHDGEVDVYSIASIGDDEWRIAPYMMSVRFNSDDVDYAHPVVNHEVSGSVVKHLCFSIYPFADLDIGLSDEDLIRYGAIDLMDEANAMLALVEALSCRNVTHSALPVRKQSKKSKKRGDAFDFDEYRVLELKHHNVAGAGKASSDHRSPREHLRRGHIRRLPSGNVWVQACIVNAGVGGKIHKDYVLGGVA